MSSKTDPTAWMWAEALRAGITGVALTPTAVEPAAA